MNSKLREDSVDFLFRSILQLKTVDECYDFFEDLCTVPEIKAMSQRLVVAHKTGASTATISRVNRALNYGCDGYEMVFRRLSEEEKEEK